ncbi:MAG TPA: ribonuclease Y, partial [Oscillatoriaceae cyanobacterium]
MLNVIIYLIMGSVLFILGAVAVFVGYRKYNQADNLRLAAEAEAEKLRSEALLEADKAKQRALAEAATIAERKEQELRDQRAEIKGLEKRVIQKEEALERKLEQLEQRDEAYKAKEDRLHERERALDDQNARMVKELERISGLSADSARSELLRNLEAELRHDAGIMIREAEAQAREQAEKKAREIVTTAIQRCAVDHTVDATVTVVSLPSDEMKGRIIGREGRNIRALEAATGIDLIIDDTPEAVILSSFDPVRREVARLTLERLIADGRIHPTRIDEVVEKARTEVEAKIKEEGENACLEAQVTGVHPELAKVLGRLRYRTSYGQNVLRHSIEVAHIAAAMAAELGGDIQLARRAGLLHDIGKALSHEVEGPHALVGGDLCRRYNESPKTVNAVAAH